MPAIEGSDQQITKSSNKTLQHASADVSWKACPGDFEGESDGMILRTTQGYRESGILLNTKDSTHAIKRTFFEDRKEDVGGPT